MSASYFGSARCAWCNGTGRRPEGDCEVCHGKGVVTVFQPTTTCSRCWGSGRARNGWVHSFPYCPACAGTGWTQTPTKQKAAGA